MPTYRYQGYNLKGQSVSGEVSAESIDGMHNALSQQGIVLVREKELTRLVPKFCTRRINNTELYLVLQEFITLMSAGHALLTVLEFLSKQSKKSAATSILEEIAVRVKQGESLSDAASYYPAMFDEYLLASIRVGEKTGEIVNPVKHYIAYLKTKMSLSAKVRQAITYPVFLLITLCAVLIILFLFVLPGFSDMYAGFNAELPASTRFLLKIVEHFHVILFILILCMAGMVVIYRLISRVNKVRMFINKTVLKLPLSGVILHNFYIAQICRIVSSLLGSGVTLVDAIQHTATGLKNRYLQRQLSETSRQVIEGLSWSVALSNSNLFDEKSRGLIRAGEESGRLQDMLQKISEFHAELLEYRISRMMTLIEPIMMLVIGVLIGGIILVMYLPVFSIADIIK